MIQIEYNYNTTDETPHTVKITTNITKHSNAVNIQVPQKQMYMSNLNFPWHK